MSMFTDAAPAAPTLVSKPSPELVRRVRELVVKEGHDVTSVSRLTGLSRTQIHNIVTGRCYREDGGPIRKSPPRVKGERRCCSRCRFRYDEAMFAIFRDQRTGICANCVKPEDFEVENKSWALRKRQATQRAALRKQIDQLTTLPWGKSMLDAADRAELEQRRTEIRRALVVCGAPWSRPRMGRGRRL